MEAAKVKGKIVFFNAAMDPTKVSTFSAYGEAGHQRTAGPRKAAEKGAVGALVRSLTLIADDIPHSGVTIFEEIQPIPALGLGIQSAERLSALLSKEKQLKVYIRLDCKKHKDQFEKLSEQDKIKFIQDNTSMIKRPILENNGKVLAFGFDEEQFKKIIKTLKIKSGKEFKEFRKNEMFNNNIPSKPDIIYKNKGWKGWAVDWLGG